MPRPGLGTLACALAALGCVAAPVLAKPAAPPWKAKPVVEAAEYVVRLTSPTTAGPQSETAIQVSVKPQKGWKLNQEFPARLELTSLDGAKIRKAKQSKKDARTMSEKGGASWNFAVDLEKAGTHRFSAEVRFAVCTDDICDPKRETVTGQILVQ